MSSLLINIRSQPTIPTFILSTLENIYLASSIPLLIFTSILHPTLTLSGHLPQSYEFLPLMITSVWCSLGLWSAWGRLIWGIWMGVDEQGGGLKID